MKTLRVKCPDNVCKIVRGVAVSGDKTLGTRLRHCLPNNEITFCVRWNKMEQDCEFAYS